MTVFLRLLAQNDKSESLSFSCSAFRAGASDAHTYEADEETFLNIPGAPFAYWVSNDVRESFRKHLRLQGDGRRVERGLFTGDDFRFLRLAWEVPQKSIEQGKWGNLSKGGSYSPYYADIYLCVRSEAGFGQIHESIVQKYTYLNGNSDWVLHPECSYGRAGLTYPLRTTKDFAARVLPSGCFWTNKGISIFESAEEEVSQGEALRLLAIVNSRAFRELLSLRMGAAHTAARSYEEGIVASTPWPKFIDSNIAEELSDLAQQIWRAKRKLDITVEVSHQYLMPLALLDRLISFDVKYTEFELVRIQSRIDDICFDLYGFSAADRAAAMDLSATTYRECDEIVDELDDSDGDDSVEMVDHADGLRSWAIGVAFGRFDWRLASGERDAPAEPDPFDPLPAKSPGMLPEGAEAFHAHAGILVDDQGHPNDLPRLVEEVLVRVQADVPGDVRRWLQRDFFPLHLRQYSKSRRKAPIYWPLSTASGSYTLWLYYPSLTSQTLYTAVNDFVEPKLEQVSRDAAKLREKGAARSRDDEKTFEALQSLELELIELRDTMLNIAPTYRPNHDDGVQITAAPLWPLFRHKPWQKILKDTWAKLEKGDFDWAHLAMSYWPERVREKCKTDKSLAIAHDLEHLYVEPEAKPKGTRGRKTTGGGE